MRHVKVRTLELPDSIAGIVPCEWQKRRRARLARSGKRAEPRSFCGYIYLFVCPSLRLLCTDINRVGGGYTQTRTSVSLCERAVRQLPARCREKKKKKKKKQGRGVGWGVERERSLFFTLVSLLNLPASRLWSSPRQSSLPVALNGPGSYNAQ